MKTQHTLLFTAVAAVVETENYRVTVESVQCADQEGRMLWGEAPIKPFFQWAVERIPASGCCYYGDESYSTSGEAMAAAMDALRNPGLRKSFGEGAL